jgi:hypothetical protein
MRYRINSLFLLKFFSFMPLRFYSLGNTPLLWDLLFSFLFISGAYILQLGIFWKIFLFIWFGAMFIAKFLNLFAELSSAQKTIFSFMYYGYPVIGNFLEYMIHHDVISYSWRVLNCLEHIAIMIALSFLFFLFLKKTTDALPRIQYMLFYFSLLITVGSAIEILQYCYRIFFVNPSLVQMSSYYTDSIIDMMTNFFGAFVSVVFLLFLRSKRHAKIG